MTVAALKMKMGWKTLFTFWDKMIKAKKKCGHWFDISAKVEEWDQIIKASVMWKVFETLT